MKTQFVVDLTLVGKTVKQYFELQGYSTTQIKRFKFDGYILVNGVPITVRYQLKLGDVVDIATNNRLETPSFAREPAKILFADKFLYVAYKPYNVAIHPDLAHREETFGNMLATTFGNGFELHLITRLDKTTDGLVLGAFDEVTAQKLNDVQQKHEISKVYHAVVEGHLQGEGKIDLPLLRQDNKTVIDENGKPALSFYKELSFDGQNTLVELTLVTGRTHQLRAHLSAIGFPIVGDTLYGAQAEDKIRLSCVKLSFLHPYSRQMVTVTLPKEF